LSDISEVLVVLIFKVGTYCKVKGLWNGREAMNGRGEANERMITPDTDVPMYSTVRRACIYGDELHEWQRIISGMGCLQSARRGHVFFFLKADDHFSWVW
jgi:hypothetical protein